MKEGEREHMMHRDGNCNLKSTSCSLFSTERITITLTGREGEQEKERKSEKVKLENESHLFFPLWRQLLGGHACLHASACNCALLPLVLRQLHTSYSPK